MARLTRPFFDTSILSLSPRTFAISEACSGTECAS